MEFLLHLGISSTNDQGGTLSRGVATLYSHFEEDESIRGSSHRIKNEMGMVKMNYSITNKEHWDEAAIVHKDSPKGYYDIEGFKQGKLSLKKIHIDELGDIKGKKILHLLCHIGLDTLSLARLGADVVGVDISPKSIEIAKELAKECNLSAKFICSDVYKIREILDDKFDIVFASHGVICWLKDLNEFMKNVERYLKPKGHLYMMDGHPMSIIMTDEPDGKELKVARTYYRKNEEPIYCEPSEDYANKEMILNSPTYEWQYTLSDIINSVCAASLKLEYLHEFPFCDDNYYNNMEKDSEGWWRFKAGNIIPLMFSLKATKYE